MEHESHPTVLWSINQIKSYRKVQKQLKACSNSEELIEQQQRSPWFTRLYSAVTILTPKVKWHQAGVFLKYISLMTILFHKYLSACLLLSCFITRRYTRQGQLFSQTSREGRWDDRLFSIVCPHSGTFFESTGLIC